MIGTATTHSGHATASAGGPGKKGLEGRQNKKIRRIKTKRHNGKERKNEREGDPVAISRRSEGRAETGGEGRLREQKERVKKRPESKRQKGKTTLCKGQRGCISRKTAEYKERRGWHVGKRDSECPPTVKGKELNAK